MAKVVIRDLAPWDGEYEFDETYLTNRDLHLIKRVAGVRAAELGEAFAAGDNDLLLAMVLIATARHGKTIPENDLWDAPLGCLDIVFPEADKEAEAVDPPAAPRVSNVSGALPERSSEISSGSLDSQPASDPSLTGDRGSDITRTFDRQTLAS